MAKKISVTMLGTGSPRPNLERYPTSQLMVIDNLPILVDCGDGATTQLLKLGYENQQIKHLFITHLHADHCLGYGQFLIGGWTAGRRELTIVGPVGTKRFHQKCVEMFEDDIKYRMSLGRPATGILEDVTIIEVDDNTDEIKTDLPAKITTERMVHYVPTYAYRFEIDDKVVVFSGDTAPHKGIVDISKNADLLVIASAVAKTEIYSADPNFKHIWENLQKEHCTPAQAAQVATDAGAKQIVLTHFLPGVDPKQVYEEAKVNFTGEVIVCEDLTKVEI